MEESLSARERTSREQREVETISREHYEYLKDQLEHFEYTNLKAVDQLAKTLNADPLNGQFFHHGASLYGAYVGSYPLPNGDFKALHLPEPRQSTAVPYIGDINGGKGVKMLSPMSDTQARFMSRQRKVSLKFRPLSLPLDALQLPHIPSPVTAPAHLQNTFLPLFRILLSFPAQFNLLPNLSRVLCLSHLPRITQTRAKAFVKHQSLFNISG
jgi:hypothetical protein